MEQIRLLKILTNYFKMAFNTELGMQMYKNAITAMLGSKKKPECFYLEIQDSLGNEYNVRYACRDCLCDIKKDLSKYKNLGIDDLTNKLSIIEDEQQNYFNDPKNACHFKKDTLPSVKVRTAFDVTEIMNAHFNPKISGENDITYDILDVKRCTTEMADLQLFMSNN